MPDSGSRLSEDAIAALLSRNLTEAADNTAALLTLLDVQARILARLESRPEDDVVEEISDLLKQRRRQILRELDTWTDTLEYFRRGERGH